MRIAHEIFVFTSNSFAVYLFADQEFDIIIWKVDVRISSVISYCNSNLQVICQ